MTREVIRLARPDVGAEELAAVAEVLESGQLTMGPWVERFERALAEAIGTADAVAVSSGTAALHLAMLALGVGEGDEVIVPAYTFPATANAVELCGGRAVLVDVDPETFLVRPELVAEAVTSRTRAVLAVHLFGRPVEWEELQTAVPQDVALVEDAAGALGASYRGTPCGALGLMACLSFHPRKIVTTGEGGAVTTDEAELAASIRRLRHHGIAAGAPTDIPAPGLNYRLADVLCALGVPQVERLETAARGARARRGVVRGPSHARRRRAGRERGRPPRVAGICGHARPSRRGARRPSGPTGSRRRSGRTRSTRLRRTATVAPFLARTPPSRARSPCRSRGR